MEMTRSVKEEMDGEVFISHQSRHSSFIDKLVQKLFPICNLNWLAHIYVFQGKGINRRNESTTIINLQIATSWFCTKIRH